MKNSNNVKLSGDPVNEAAEWFLILLDEDLSEEHYLEWQTWLAKNDANQKAFSKAEECWENLDNVTDLPLAQEKTTVNRNKHTTSLLRRFAPIAATIFVSLSIGLMTYRNIPAPLEITTYQTDLAEHKNIQLDDGSKVTLGAKSIINVQYSDIQRHVTLVRGEAVFDVAKNKARPFVVKIGKGTVTAIGTKFNIHSSRHNVIVTVLEGSVEVNPYLVTGINPDNDDIPHPIVPAGNAVSYRNNGYISGVVPVNTEAATSWEQGLLVRVDTPLPRVIADVNRYSLREIIIGDPSLNDIRFTGTVLNDGIDNWLRGLSVAYPIKVLDSGHGAILLLEKGK